MELTSSGIITVFKDSDLPDLDDNLCIICLQSGDTRDDLCLCGYTYHTSCWNKWIKSHRDCPTCRKQFSNSEIRLFIVNDDTGDFTNDTDDTDLTNFFADYDFRELNNINNRTIIYQYKPCHLIIIIICLMLLSIFMYAFSIIIIYLSS